MARALRGERSELRRASVRLAVQFTALIVVLLSLAGAVVYYLAAAGSEEALQQRLEAAVELDNPRDAPLDVFLAVLNRGRLEVSRDVPSGLPVASSLSAVAAGAGSIEETVEADGTTYRVLTAQERRGRVVQAAVDTQETRNQLNRLLFALIAAVVCSAAVAALFSVLAARAAMRPLARALELQRRFVSDASHELRTPLTLLSTRAQLLRRRAAGQAGGASPGELDRLIQGLDEVVADAGVLTGILDDLLVAADPRKPGTLEEVDLAAVARQTAAAFGPAFSDRGLALHTQLPDVPVPVLGNEAALQRVFTALLSNALDFGRTEVTVSVAARNRDAVVTVADDGPGLPPELAGALFDRFSSVRPAPAGHTRHYGLGLALVAEIAARFGGSVSAEPETGHGAVLVVRLPLSARGF
ncbi:sensor histidine kinase [Arthrobacter caoxuetaonis]|uniref:sensor histidine kinase n=1 Tax=Arthrobacter caoxuetaonis TaxID=2886935 RepID=UPI001D142F87|nr:HAMP domain-containing histidine kinase [Arthrobacter caoxuetaonis]